jgi:hypothetical protein
MKLAALINNSMNALITQEIAVGLEDLLGSIYVLLGPIFVLIIGSFTDYIPLP